MLVESRLVVWLCLLLGVAGRVGMFEKVGMYETGKVVIA